MSFRGARFGIWAIGAALVIVGAVIAFLPYIASTQIVRDRIAFEMSAWSGYRVELGAAPEIEVWPFRAILRNVALSGWYDPDRKPVVVAERVDVDLSPLAALRGDIVFSTARLVRPTLHLSAGEGGMSLPVSPNAGRIARSIETAREAVSADPGKPDLRVLPADPFGTVAFVDGRIVADRGGKEEEMVTSVAGALEWPALDRPARLSLSGIWRGENVVLEANAAQPLVLLAGGDAPLSVSVKSPPAGLSFDGIANLSVNSYVLGAVKFASPSLHRLVQWSSQGSLPGSGIGNVSLAGNLTGDRNRLKVENAELRLDADRAVGVLDVALTEGMPVIAGTLAFDTLDLGAFLAGFTPLEDNPAAAGSADFSPRVGLDLRLSAAAAEAGPVALIDLAATVQVKPMSASFDLSDAQAYGGRFQGSLRLDRQPERDHLELKLMGTEISGAAIAASAPSIPLVPAAQGNLALTLKGSGNRWRDLLETGTGTASISFGKGSIPDFDLTAFANRLEGTGFFPLSDVAKGALPIQSIKFKAAISRGVALIETGEINAPSDSILLTGLVPYIGGGLALSGRLQSPQQPGDDQASQPGPAVAEQTFFVGGSWTEPFVAPIGNSPVALPAD